jgi:hypothetical protein
MNVEILNQNNSTISTNSSSSCFNSNSSALQPKKGQAILALNPPNNAQELRHFLGMVQYYRDMWARHSEMLTPLTDLVGDFGETKTTRMKKTKKNLGGGIPFINKHLTT